MTIALNDVADFINSTQNAEQRLTWTNLTTDKQEFVALPRILRKERVSIEGGDNITWRVVTGTSGNARDVGIYSEDRTIVTDNISTASIPWRRTETSWSWDKTEFLGNKGRNQLLNLIKLRRIDGWIDLADHLETVWWSKPPDSSDKLQAFGIDYWNVFDDTGVHAATGAGGFTTSLPTGFTTVADIDPATVNRWGNYSHQYVNITNDDLIAKMRKGAYKTKFKAPIAVPTIGRGGMRREYFSNYAVVSEFERSLERQNDNLGDDIASKDGLTTFLRNPIHVVPHLDDNASETDPVIQIDWDKFWVCFMAGDYLVEGKAEVVAGFHRVVRQHVDLTWNIKCVDRRSLAYYAK